MLMSLFFLLAAAATPQPAALKTFGDWIVGCDNGRACHAVGLMPESLPEDALTISVRRGPEAGARPVIAFEPRSETRAVAVAADGKLLRLRLAVDQNGGLAVSAADTRVLLAAMRGAAELQLRTADGSPAGRVSLRGVSAALLYMDEQQRRIGTVTALVRPGGKPASAVPAPPPLPRVHEVRPAGTSTLAAAPVRRIDALRKRAGCDESLTLAENPPERQRLDPRTTLVRVTCWRGAYNATSLVLVARTANGGDLAPARFDYNASAGEQAGPTVPPDGAYWNEEKGRLASFFKGRGLGDCGAGQEWAWDGGMFRLIHAEAMGECRGSTDYITTWRAEVVRR
jgi:hypothetical protein